MDMMGITVVQGEEECRKAKAAVSILILISVEEEEEEVVEEEEEEVVVEVVNGVSLVVKVMDRH